MQPSRRARPALWLVPERCAERAAVGFASQPARWPFDRKRSRTGLACPWRWPVVSAHRRPCGPVDGISQPALYHPLSGHAGERGQPKPGRDLDRLRQAHPRLYPEHPSMAPGLAQHLLQQYALRGRAERVSHMSGRLKLSATWRDGNRAGVIRQWCPTVQTRRVIQDGQGQKINLSPFPKIVTFRVFRHSRGFSSV